MKRARNFMPFNSRMATSTKRNKIAMFICFFKITKISKWNYVMNRKPSLTTRLTREIITNSNLICNSFPSYPSIGKYSTSPIRVMLTVLSGNNWPICISTILRTISLYATFICSHFFSAPLTQPRSFSAAFKSCLPVSFLCCGKFRPALMRAKSSNAARILFEFATAPFAFMDNKILSPIKRAAFSRTEIMRLIVKPGKSNAAMFASIYLKMVNSFICHNTLSRIVVSRFFDWARRLESGVCQRIMTSLKPLELYHMAGH